ncbi:unnamed protein product [Ectocarpus sp. CCAP 1310/34]|nr:unnamed protein product [Ectocarpus sp. CCAP 1310/34]
MLTFLVCSQIPRRQVQCIFSYNYNHPGSHRRG